MPANRFQTPTILNSSAGDRISLRETNDLAAGYGSMRPFRTALHVLLILLAIESARAQSTFDVASVKRKRSGSADMRFDTLQGGRFTVANAPALELIRFAYRLQDFQIVGAPGWTRSERFDIAAKLPDGVGIGPQGPGAPAGPTQLMLRTLLMERFRLKAHVEQRELPAYALVMARADRKPGVELKPATIDCEGIIAAGQRILLRRPCGLRSRPGTLTGGSVPMSSLVSALTAPIGRMVIDRTGLTGRWDFTLTFAADPTRADADAPSLPTAVVEQLGLRLESTRAPIDVLIVDGIDRPTPD